MPSATITKGWWCSKSAMAIAIFIPSDSCGARRVERGAQRKLMLWTEVSLSLAALIDCGNHPLPHGGESGGGTHVEQPCQIDGQWMGQQISGQGGDRDKQG